MNFPELIQQALDEDKSWYPSIPGTIEDIEGVEEIEDVITDNGRWSIFHRAVYKHNGRFWAVDYSVGATEMQDDDTWFEAEEVWPVEVTVTKYMTAKQIKESGADV